MLLRLLKHFLKSKNNLFLLFKKITVIELVGGSGPHEGNIMLHGRPVCDDIATPENAQVVCRFVFEFVLVFVFVFIVVFVFVFCL